MRRTKYLLIAGGVINACLAVFHLFFWTLFDWPVTLAGLSPDNRGILQAMTVQVVIVYGLFAWLSIREPGRFLASRTGRNISGGIALFYLIRAVLEPIFFPGADAASMAVIVICLGAAAIYGRVATLQPELRLAH